jgi:hypothetical protein
MLLRQRWNKMAGLAACLLLGLVFVEGVVNTTYPRQARWDVFAHPPNYVSVVQQLQRPARLFIAAALNANLASAFGLETWDSLYMFSPPRMYDIYQQYAAPAAAISMREATVLPPEAVLDRAGISHILIRQKLPGLFAATVMRSYAVAYADDYVCLFRRAHAMPRYVFSSEYQVTDHAAALKLIGTTPRQEILLESAPPFLSSRNSVDDPGPELVSAKLNSLTLRVAAPRPGLLYMADAYFDGWSATVNGVSTPILPANYAFRAVAVPAGDVLVKLSYLPKGFLVGLIVSMVSVIATVTLLLRREVSA